MTKRTRERTPFGERLHLARMRAGLSQSTLAKLAGISQSTMAEAETIAHGSSKTVQLAAALRVDSRWLATGEGDMQSLQSAPLVLNEPAPHWTGGQSGANPPIPIAPAASIGRLIAMLGDELARHDNLVRISVAPLLQRLAEHPEETEDIALHVQRALARGNAPPPESLSSPSSAPRSSAEPKKTPLRK